MLRLQRKVPPKRPVEIPHVRQPPGAHRAQSEGATDEDEEVTAFPPTLTFCLFSVDMLKFYVVFEIPCVCYTINILGLQ